MALGLSVPRPASANAPHEDIFLRATTVVGEYLGLDPASISLHSDFIDDLGADSLDCIEIVLSLSDEFETFVPAPQSLEIRTIGDFLDQYRESAQSENGSKLQDDTDRLRIWMLGHEGHGKTVLTEAVSQYFSGLTVPDEIELTPEQEGRDATLTCSNIDVLTETRNYRLGDCPMHDDSMKLLKLLTTGVGKMDGAILVVSAVDGLIPQTLEQIRLARRMGVPGLVVFINKVDQVDDEEMLKLVEMELRELLSSYDFPGDDIPIVKGSALHAMNGTQPEIGENAIKELMQAVDDYIPTPDRPIDQPFLMPIQDVFSISGGGTVVTGRVERGVISVGDEVEIVGIRPTGKAVCIGIEMFRKLLDRAEAGDNAGVVLRGVNRDEVERGQVLCRPGSMHPRSRFEAEAYILTEREGGRRAPFFDGHRPQFFFRTTDVTGTVELPEGTEMVMPGDILSFEVELIAPIALEEGLRFALREGGRTIGAGVVTGLVD